MNKAVRLESQLPARASKTILKKLPKIHNGFSQQKENDALRQYLNISPFIFLVLDQEGKVELINKKGCEILGVKDKSELIGKSWFSNFAPPGKGKIYRKIFSKAIENNLDVASRGDREAPLTGKDGSVSMIKWSYALVHDEHGKPAGVICSGEDVTDKRELEAKFLNAMLEGQESERKRLAKDLHDGLAILLTTAKLNLGAIEAADKPLDKKRKKILDNSIALLTTALNEIRTITLDLSPIVLEDFGLVSALKDLCHNLSKAHHSTIKVTSFGIKKRLAPHLETALYRIAQELIHNALRHSKGDSIALQLFQQGGTLTLTVEDNGTGFDTARLFEYEGSGLKNIRSRVKNLQGFFHMESSEEKGTLAIVEIPVKA